MAFYNQTLIAVKVGRQRLENLGVPTRRPTDYFCEHVKSDGHMTRVRQNYALSYSPIHTTILTHIHTNIYTYFILYID